MENFYTSQSLGALFNDVFGFKVAPAGEGEDFLAKQASRYQQVIQNMLNQNMIEYEEDNGRRIFNMREAVKASVLLHLADLRIDAVGRRAFADEYSAIPLFDDNDKKLYDDGFAALFNVDKSVYLYVDLHDAKLIYTLSTRPDFELHDEVQASLRLPVKRLINKLFKRAAEVRDILRRFNRI